MLQRTLISLIVGSAKSRGQLLSSGFGVGGRVQSQLCPITNNQDCKMLHTKSRSSPYPYKREGELEVKRFPVPDERVSWTVGWPEYSPVELTAPFVLTAAWADPPLDRPGFKPSWNSLDGKVNRVAGLQYAVDEEGRPVNPSGRTGLKGRGVLGRWGPNHAADPIVTRWKRDNSGSVVRVEDRPVLQFVSIERKDGGGWAIPGGMVDPGEKVSVTLKREFMEEAMDSTMQSEEENAANAAMLDQFFKGGSEIYSGYVDDPRNTDNAWMETVAVMFHDEDGDKVANFRLKAGDDAKSLKWQDIDGQITLYASHKDFIKRVSEKLGAHW